MVEKSHVTEHAWLLPAHWWILRSVSSVSVLILHTGKVLALYCIRWENWHTFQMYHIMQKWPLHVYCTSRNRTAYWKEAVKPTGYDIWEASTEFLRYRICLNESRSFVIKFGAQICEVVLNLSMQRQTRSLCTKLKLASPNHHVRSLLFWEIIQYQAVIP